jgi:M6 family metalloprotease-like protein
MIAQFDRLRRNIPIIALVVLATLAIAPAGSSSVEAWQPAPPRPIGPRAITQPLPRAGDQPLLVVLADFSDRPGVFSGQAWQQFFFGADGFADYYRQASYDQLRYTGDVVGLNGSSPVTNSAAVAYVRLPHSITFYANGGYGYSVNNTFPKNHGGVVYHALLALDAAGFDFGPYADPATKKVENLVVVFAGKNYYYSGDPAGSLLATAYRISWAGLNAAYISSGGQQFDNYTFCPEQRADGSMAGIGICAHEQGHGLGMPDLYDFSYTTSGAGNFDIMAYGTYGASDGQYPIDFSVFSKEFTGWITPTIVGPGASAVVLRPATQAPDFVKLYPSGNTGSPEYFLLENRQGAGLDRDWTASGVGLCPGLVIWHVDQSIVQSWYPINMVNTLPSASGPPHFGAAVVEADGNAAMRQPPLNYGECGDTWQPGRSWNAFTNPSSRLWDGADSRLALTVLEQDSDGSLTLSISVNGAMQAVYLPITQR